MKKWSVGDKVKIQIYNPEAWCNDLLPLFNGQEGSIEEIKENGYNGYKFNDPQYLFRFDTAQKRKAWAAASPITRFWFDGLDFQPTI